MSKPTFYQRYGRKLIKRGDPWYCHYCKRPLIPDDAKYGDLEYYDIELISGTCIYQVEYSYKKITIKADYGKPSVDHILPRCKGGTDDLDNLVLACWDCNTKKNRTTYELFMERLNNDQT